MKFRTYYDIDYEQHSEVGSPIKDVFKARLDKNGKKVIEKKGTEDLYAYIQSFADSCDINLILKKFVATNDATLLQKSQGAFLDLTEAPTDYFDMINKINDAKVEFDNLPESVRKKFDYNVDKFIGSIGTSEWYSHLMMNNENVKKPIQDEKKEGEE